MYAIRSYYVIVQRIMRDHGGEIEINSEPGRGTRLTLRFPREDARLYLLNAPGREVAHG